MNLMAFEVEKQQAALIPLALLRRGVLEVIPSCSWESLADLGTGLKSPD